MLGDKVKQLTSAMGIKPCQRCNERANKLNHLSRRFMIKLLGITPLTQLKVLPLGASSTDEALELVRNLNVIQHQFHLNNNRFLTEVGMRTGLYAHLQHKPEWIAEKLHPFQMEILDGWNLDFSGSPTHYLVILYERSNVKRNAFITDETAIIYRSKILVGHQPIANELSKAVDFPGAVPYSDFQDETQNIVRRYLNAAFRKARTICVGQCWQICGCCGGHCTPNQYVPPKTIAYNCGQPICVWCIVASCTQCKNCFGQSACCLNC